MAPIEYENEHIPKTPSRRKTLVQPAGRKTGKKGTTKGLSDRETFVKKTLQTVFTALLIDILAFTIILPLFPRIMEYYEQKDGQDQDSLVYKIMTGIRWFKQLIGGSGTRLDTILFGGALGSLFSFLQFVSSPYIGILSDKYGRRTILLLSMIGNGLSMTLWLFGRSFELFILSRIIGGLTEGNVQMSIAMISDITTPETRSRGLALVGIAFSLGFTFGPPLGAYCAKLDLFKIFPNLKYLPFNDYSGPALFALILIVVETLYMFIALPETIDFKRRVFPDEVKRGPIRRSARLAAKAEPLAKPNASHSETKDESTISSQTASLWLLSIVHFLFLMFFSGMEFTLTFLTHDRFSFSHTRQGALLGTMGLLSAFVQGGYVRRLAGKKVPERFMVMQGIGSCAVGLLCCGFAKTTTMLWVGAVCLSFTSGTVVSCLTAMASMTGKKASADSGAASGIPNYSDEDEINHKPSRLRQRKSGMSTSDYDASTDEDDYPPVKRSSPVQDYVEHSSDSEDRGHVLGKFRSMGQLGRSIGPIFACSGYWILGSNAVYILGSVLILGVLALVYLMVPAPNSYRATTPAPVDEDRNGVFSKLVNESKMQEERWTR